MCMNSVYKRYLLITLLGIALMTGLAVRSRLVILAQIDAINDYVSENNTLKDFDKHNAQARYFGYYDNGKELQIIPSFESAKSDLCHNGFSGVCAFVMSLAAAFMYLYERSAATGDFCAALPVKARSAYLMKALCLALVLLCDLLLRVWAAYIFNSRVPLCNASASALSAEPISPVDIKGMSFIAESTSLFEFFSFGAALLFLGECTGKAYLPVCIWALASYAVAGSVSGAVNFGNYYFDLKISRELYTLGGAGVKQWIDIAIGAAAFLWGLYLAGRGDMSRRDRVFRFKWVENMAMLCITLCGVLCGFEIIFIAELNYSLTLPMCFMLLISVGVGVYFAARRVILWLGR